MEDSENILPVISMLYRGAKFLFWFWKIIFQFLMWILVNHKIKVWIKIRTNHKQMMTRQDQSSKSTQKTSWHIFHIQVLNIGKCNQPFIESNQVQKQGKLPAAAGKLMKFSKFWSWSRLIVNIHDLFIENKSSSATTVSRCSWEATLASIAWKNIASHVVLLL